MHLLSGWASQIVPEVQSLDTATLTLGASFDLGTASPSAFPPSRIVRDILVAPDTTDTLVVTMTNGDEVVAYASGSQLPDAITNESIDRIVFRDESRIVGINDSNSGFQAYEIEFDPLRGVSITQAFPNLADGFNTSLSIDRGVALVGSGVLFDETTAERRGRLPLPTGSIFLRSAVFDPFNSAAYSIDNRSAIHVYTTNPLTYLGGYDLQSNLVSNQILEPSQDALFIAAQDQILRVATSDLLASRAAGCIRSDFSDQLVSGVYIQFDCGLSDLVVDVDRGLAYGGIRGRNGPDGNSIATIDTGTIEIVARLPLDGDPEDLSLSVDGTSLYVARVTSSRVAQVDTLGNEFASEIPLGFAEISPGRLDRAREVGALAVSANDGRNVLISTRSTREVLFSRDGALDADIGGTTISFTDLVLSTDADLALGYAAGFADIMEVGSSGVATTRSRETFLAGRIAARGDLVHSTRGQVFDLSSLVARSDCPVPDSFSTTTAVAPGIDGELVHYLGFENGVAQVASCRLADGETLSIAPVPLLGEDSGAVIALVSVRPGLLAVLLDNRTVFINEPDRR